MELKTKNKAIVLVFSTRKIINMYKNNGEKNFEELYFKAMNNSDIEMLAKIIYEVAEDEAGTRAFNSNEEVYEFIDDYKTENKHSYADLFKKMTSAINEEGFFTTKMKKEEIEQKSSNPLINLDMNKLVEQSAEKAVTKIAEQELSKVSRT